MPFLSSVQNPCVSENRAQRVVLLGDWEHRAGVSPSASVSIYEHVSVFARLSYATNNHDIKRALKCLFIIPSHNISLLPSWNATPCVCIMQESSLIWNIPTQMWLWLKHTQAMPLPLVSGAEMPFLATVRHPWLYSDRWSHRTFLQSWKWVMGTIIIHYTNYVTLINLIPWFPHLWNKDDSTNITPQMLWGPMWQCKGLCRAQHCRQ